MTDTEDRPAGTPAVSRGGRRGKAADRHPLPGWAETALLVATALVVALLVKTLFMQAFYIPSGSMRETLQKNDRILVEKVSYWFDDVERGDVVVFDDPANWLTQEDGQTADGTITKMLAAIGLYPTGGHLVKRVIGVGGDTVACSDGRVEVNGAALDEDAYVTLPTQACTGTWTVEVPAGHLWVMGDNRNHSADSRVHIGDPGGGFIPVDDVVGKVFVVVWPSSRWQLLNRPGTFEDVALADPAGFVSTAAPFGLALTMCLPLYRRLTTAKRSYDRRT